MRTIQQLVSAEIHYCVSGLVATLAGYTPRMRASGCALYDHKNPELMTTIAQAWYLAAPVHDYESAAREAGWRPRQTDTGFYNADNALSDFGAESWQMLCEDNAIEPHDREVYEHWLISDWLADKLEAKGEKVDRDFAGMTIWARTTTGQSIELDSVIEEIHADLVREYGQ